MVANKRGVQKSLSFFFFVLVLFLFLFLFCFCLFVCLFVCIVYLFVCRCKHNFWEEFPKKKKSKRTNIVLLNITFICKKLTFPKRFAANEKQKQKQKEKEKEKQNQKQKQN